MDANQQMSRSLQGPKQKEFDEQETEAVAHAALGVILERDGFRRSDITAAGIQLSGQERIVTNLASTICRVADLLEADADFQQGVEELPVVNEQGAYNSFAQVSWNVVFRSGGITWPRVVGLLIFAGKLAAKVLRKASDLASTVGQLISSWICRFIKDYVWRWITDSGGWIGMGEDQQVQYQNSGWGSKVRLVVGAGAVFIAGVAVGWAMHL